MPVNFVVLLALIGPGSSHELDLKLRRLGVEAIIGRGVQFWLVASTITARVLFGLILWRKPRAGLLVRPLRIEGTLPRLTKFSPMLYIQYVLKIQTCRT